MFDTEVKGIESTDESTEPSWWIDEGVPGVGDRPEWMPDKFKTVSDMSKSYSELEKKFGSAPKEYDFSKAKEWIESEDVFNNISEAARAKGVPQDFMDTVLENIGDYVKSDAIDFEAEKAKLGDNADEKLQQLESFFKNNFGEDVSKALAETMVTGESIKALMEIEKKMTDTQPKVPTEGDSTGAGESLADIESEMVENLPKYQTDSKYRNELQQRMARVAKTSGFIDKTQA